MNVSLHTIELFERPVTLRLPFRFGAATVTGCPQAFVRVRAECCGRATLGMTAELMVPKWFDKSPKLSHEQNFEQLRQALRISSAHYLAEKGSHTPWQLSERYGEPSIEAGISCGMPRLAAQFGSALIDKAIADAVLRAAEVSWCDGVKAGILGDPFASRVALRHPASIDVRHTVGLADRLTEADAGTAPDDDLPCTLQDAISAYGLRYFKIKLSGEWRLDSERLEGIAALLDTQAREYWVTLDGNETFVEADALKDFWQCLSGTRALRRLVARVLYLEQPFHREIALRTSIAALDLGVPVILDESDDRPDAFETGIALGYRGISSKACKGIYRSLRNAARATQPPAGLFLCGEDLTCQAGLAVQQDTMLAASLGISHVERNGHHYGDGFGSAREEAARFGRAHAGFYSDRGGCVRLAVRGGQLDLATLHVPGFAVAAEPQWETLRSIESGSEKT